MNKMLEQDINDAQFGFRNGLGLVALFALNALLRHEILIQHQNHQEALLQSKNENRRKQHG